MDDFMQDYIVDVMLAALFGFKDEDNTAFLQRYNAIMKSLHKPTPDEFLSYFFFAKGGQFSFIIWINFHLTNTC